MEKNAILATVLVILILLGYQWYLSHPPGVPSGAAARMPGAGRALPPTSPHAPDPAGATLPPASQARAAGKAYTPTSQQAPPRQVAVETPLMRVVFTTAGARVTSWQLKKYHRANGQPVDLIAVANPSGPGALSAWTDPEQIDGLYQVDRAGLDLTKGAPSGRLTFTQISASGMEIEKQLTVYADRYDADLSIRVRNLSDSSTAEQTRLTWGPGLRSTSDTGRRGLQPPAFWVDGKRQQENVAKLTGVQTLSGTLSWAALQDSYFAAALVPKEGEGLRGFVEKTPEEQPIVGLTAPSAALPPGGEEFLRAEVFAGPRDLGVLRHVGHHLDQLVDLGWFSFLARPAIWLLEFLDRFTGNYGVAIILVTILVRIVFYPLSARGMKSMQTMQALKPKLQAIQERYKDNPQKKREETTALYHTAGVNPMGGCLPMLAQIPIFIGLYNALANSVAMWQSHFLWIRDLTRPDSLFTASLWGGHLVSLNLLALLMGASMWWQQTMSPQSGDPQQARMLRWIMPIVFTFMFWNFPSGLVLYWLTNNLLQTGQQLIIGTPAPPLAA